MCKSGMPFLNCGKSNRQRCAPLTFLSQSSPDSWARPRRCRSWEHWPPRRPRQSRPRKLRRGVCFAFIHISPWRSGGLRAYYRRNIKRRKRGVRTGSMPNRLAALTGLAAGCGVSVGKRSARLAPAVSVVGWSAMASQSMRTPVGSGGSGGGPRRPPPGTIQSSSVRSGVTVLRPFARLLSATSSVLRDVAMFMRMWFAPPRP